MKNTRILKGEAQGTSKKIDYNLCLNYKLLVNLLAVFFVLKPMSE